MLFVAAVAFVVAVVVDEEVVFVVWFHFLLCAVALCVVV